MNWSVLTLPGQGGLIRIDYGLNDRRAFVCESAPQRSLGFVRLFNCETGGAAVHRDSRKIDGLQVHAVVWTAFENYLLQFDLAECIVLDHDEIGDL